jgi:hypothetical protein
MIFVKICVSYIDTLTTMNPGAHLQCPLAFSNTLQPSPSSLYFSHHPPNNEQEVNY